jgi:2',3'-cyclic-nucleotide 2'-phosphodiesterase (5'-nucleotidase family)
MSNKIQKLIVLISVLSIAIPIAALAADPISFTILAADPISFTILHTNDFHGQLGASGSNPGTARVAQKIADVRAAIGAGNVLLFDAGDIMRGGLLSNLQKGLPTIRYYRTIGYNAATFGNHEFDWGQVVLANRIAQAEAPPTADESPVQMIAANITKKHGGGNCTWEPFHPKVTPYEVFTVGTGPDTVRVGVIGVTTTETPILTIASATAGLCFKDPADSILHYYDAMKAQTDVIVVLSHLGYFDGGYGYGIPVYGDQTLAQKLNTAGKPVNLIIGGHSHIDLESATVIGATRVVQAYCKGRNLGRADITVNLDGTVLVSWQSISISPSDPRTRPSTH